MSSKTMNAQNIAERVLLAPYSLSLSSIDNILSEMMKGVDYADLYFQYARSEHWGLEEGLVKNATFSIEQGAGLRVIQGEQQSLAYTDDCSVSSLGNAAKKIQGANRQGQSGIIAANGSQKIATEASFSDSLLYSTDDPSQGLSSEKKVALLNWVDGVARQASPIVSQVLTSISSTFEVVAIMTSEGEWAVDVRPLIRFNLTIIAEKDGRREIGRSGGGGRYSLSEFTHDKLKTWIDEAILQAETNLQAQPTPAGEMTVVLGAGWPGVLLHEAVGHGLEGDFTRKGSSVFSGKIGERVASKGVTVVDDGTMAKCRGSLHVDDEGTPTSKTVLIEDGIVRGFMQDRLNAKLSNTARTGNGRRESYAHLPMPRMTNTYMLAGEHTHEEIIASVDDGIYCPSFAGGQVDITNGKFVFSASEAWRIEKGKLSYPLKGATLIGNGPESLTRISMIGNNLALDPGIGICGKEGQSVPVGVGQPSLRIEKITVGGTEA